MNEGGIGHVNEESKLLELMTDEKMRSEQHKTNYQMLKIELGRVQNENDRLQSDLKLLKSENIRLKKAVENSENHFSKQIESLSSQLQKEKQLQTNSQEALKSKLKKQLEESYHEKIMMLQSDGDKYREDFNKMRYDYTFLKAEYDHMKQDNARIIEEKNLRYEADMSRLHDEIANLEARLSADSNEDMQSLHRLQRENSQLNVKVKTLMTELDYLKTNETQAKIQDDQIVKIFNKQLNDLTETVKSLEAEKNSFQFIKDGLKTELSTCRENCAASTAELSSKQQENSRLKSDLEECKYQFKLKESDLKVEIAKQKNEFERQQNRLDAVIQEQNIEVEVLKEKVDKLKALISDKEQELQTVVQCREDEQFLKVSQLETEKSNLEIEICELKRVLKNKQNLFAAELDKLRGEIQSHNSQMVELKNENEGLRVCKNTTERLKSSLNDEKDSNLRRQQQMDDLIVEINNLKQVEHDLILQQTTFKNAADNLKHCNNELRAEKSVLLADHGKQVGLLNKKLEAANAQHSSTVQLFRKEVAALKLNNNKSLAALNKKNKQYSRLIKKLRQKLETAEAKLEQLAVEKAASSNEAPRLEYNQLLKKFKDLKRKHNEFRTVISNGYQSKIASFNASSANKSSLLEKDEHVINGMWQRLHTLGEEQKREMEHLAQLGNLT